MVVGGASVPLTYHRTIEFAVRTAARANRRSGSYLDARVRRADGAEFSERERDLAAAMIR